MNASALRRQNLQQGAASQIRLLVGEGAILSAKSKIEDAIFQQTKSEKIYNFDSPLIGHLNKEIKQLLNAMETTAGLVRANAVDRNLSCSNLAQYYYVIAAGFFVDGGPVLLGSTKIIPISAARRADLFDPEDFPDIRWLFSEWFGKDTKWFSSANYQEECSRVAPPLTFYDELRRWF